MHLASHAVLIGAYTRTRALTTFDSGLNVTINGPTRVGGSPRRPRRQAFQCRSKISRSLASPPADKPFAAAVSTALAKATARSRSSCSDSISMSGPRETNRSTASRGGSEAPGPRCSRASTAMLTCRHSLKFDDSTPWTERLRLRAHSPRLSYTSIPRAARVGLPKITASSLPDKTAYEAGSITTGPHIVCNAVLTGHDFRFTSTNLPSATSTYWSSFMGPTIGRWERWPTILRPHS